MAIAPQVIDELIARSDIADVVGDYVTLTQKSGSLWGLCPFHGEKTPSFHVVPERQIYHCFGCGKGGGVISFIMEIENLPYIEAVRFLAKRAGMELPETGEDEGYRRRKEVLYRLNRDAARFFHAQLHSPGGRGGLAYLQIRGLSPKTMTRFGLGWAPEGWDNLLRAMAEQGYEKKDLLDAGLTVSGKQGRMYDRFRGRVMFPIIDLRGNVIGFGGRVLGDETPKYLNSPDTIIFNKSRNLFALNLAKTTRQNRIVLTEGYMDTIALHQAGFDGAVASLGTSLTADHARLLARFTKEVVIAYDGDGAGVTAAQRAIPLLEKTGLKVKVLKVQGAKDPDEFIRKFGRESFGKLLDQSENHLEYRLEQIQVKYNLEDDGQKIEFAREAAQMIAGLESPVEREVYTGRAASLAGIAAEAMAQEVKRAFQIRLRTAKKKQERRDLLPTVQVQPRDRQLRYENLRSARAEEGILRLMLLDESLFTEIQGMTEEQFSSPTLGKIYGILRQRWQEGRSLQLGALADQLSSEEMALLAEILQKPSSLDRARQEMADYRTIVENEYMKRAGGDEESALLAARETYRKKQGISS